MTETTTSLVPKGGGLLTYPGGTTPFAWDILRNETTREYDLFRMYIDANENIETLVGVSGEEEDYILTLHAKNQWDLRTKAYRDYLERIVSGEIETMIQREILQAGHRLSTLIVDQIGRAAVSCTKVAEDGLEDPNVLLARVESLVASYARLQKATGVGSNAKHGMDLDSRIEIILKPPDASMIDVTPRKKKKT